MNSSKMSCNDINSLRCISEHNKAGVFSRGAQEPSITVQTTWDREETSPGREEKETGGRTGEEENRNNEETRSRWPAGKYQIGSLCSTNHIFWIVVDRLLWLVSPGVHTWYSPDYLPHPISSRPFRASFKLLHIHYFPPPYSQVAVYQSGTSPRALSLLFAWYRHCRPAGNRLLKSVLSTVQVSMHGVQSHILPFRCAQACIRIHVLGLSSCQLELCAYINWLMTCLLSYNITDHVDSGGMLRNFPTWYV